MLNAKLKKSGLALGIIFILSSATARAEEHNSFHYVLKSMVIAGMTDAGTINHNLNTYNGLLGKVERLASEHHRTRAGRLLQRIRILTVLSEINTRLKVQALEIPSYLKSSVLSPVYNKMKQMISATKGNDFGTVISISQEVRAEISKAKV
jgi:hypothetical protein